MSNVLVVNDPMHPENNGKVFLWQYGPSIHSKIMAAMIPEYEDQTPVPVFDMWAGATFRIRIKDKQNFVNYDDSTFDSPSAIHTDDSVLETVYNGMHDLAEFESEDNYKTHDQLDGEMRKVLGALMLLFQIVLEFNLVVLVKKLKEMAQI